MAGQYLDDYVQCQRCEFIGPEGLVVDHYVRQELDHITTPFQCKLCPAKFHWKQQAQVHKNRDHRQLTSTYRQMFWGSLRDLRVDDMVWRPAFLRGNRPGRAPKTDHGDIEGQELNNGLNLRSLSSPNWGLGVPHQNALPGL